MFLCIELEIGPGASRSSEVLPGGRCRQTSICFALLSTPGQESGARSLTPTSVLWNILAGHLLSHRGAAGLSVVPHSQPRTQPAEDPSPALRLSIDCTTGGVTVLWPDSSSGYGHGPLCVVICRLNGGPAVAMPGHGAHRVLPESSSGPFLCPLPSSPKVLVESSSSPPKPSQSPPSSPSPSVPVSSPMLGVPELATCILGEGRWGTEEGNQQGELRAVGSSESCPRVWTVSQ